MPHSLPSLVAVDIGNSRIKLGRFERNHTSATAATNELPEPTTTYDLPISDRSGQFDFDHFAKWSGEQIDNHALWLVGSVHRGAAERFTAGVAEVAGLLSADWRVRSLTFRDVSLAIEVEHPERVGIDRLLAALAAVQLRSPGRAAIVVDLGSAMTIDLVSASGAFTGGAILPGISMSARALAEQTDALPRIDVEQFDHPPAAPGKSTVAAIEAGLYWGAVGAIRELAEHYSKGESCSPDLFLTGGASAKLIEVLLATNAHTKGSGRMMHVPHLVLAGIAHRGSSGCGG